MTYDNLHLDARNKLITGIKKIATAVGGTMGTAGSNAIIEAVESPGHYATNDGYSIANSIVLSDPIEDMGRKMLLESINRANKASGDGSSTTCVLTASIIEEGLKYISDYHPMDIKRSIEDCVPLIEKELDTMTKKIENDGVIDIESLKQVATISAEDEEIGTTIADIYSQIGKTGIIYWDISKTSTDSYTIGSGITVEGAGFVSPYMCDVSETGQNTNQIRIRNPKILLTKQKISTAADFNDIGAYLHGKDIKDLVVFCDDFEPLVIPDLLKTRMMRGFRIVLVRMPVLWRDWWYEDLAKVTGAQVVDSSAGLLMRDVKVDNLGTVENIIITKEETFLDGICDVSSHVKQLEDEGTDDSKLRATRLNTKTARYYVGAQSDSALSYRRLKVEDAIGAAYQALQGGIVAGGGVSLRKIARTFDPNETVGKKILHTALCTPEQQIWANAGCSMAYEEPFTYKGINTRTKEVVDMFDAGITDPRNVVLNAVKNAISVAATVLTAPTLVTLPRVADSVPAHSSSVVQR